jgi:hypothetical protein
VSTEDLLSAFDVDHIGTVAPLFQTGYPVPVAYQQRHRPVRGSAMRFTAAELQA